MDVRVLTVAILTLVLLLASAPLVALVQAESSVPSGPPRGKPVPGQNRHAPGKTGQGGTGSGASPGMGSGSGMGSAGSGHSKSGGQSHSGSGSSGMSSAPPGSRGPSGQR